MKQTNRLAACRTTVPTHLPGSRQIIEWGLAVSASPELRLACPSRVVAAILREENAWEGGTTLSDTSPRLLIVCPCGKV